MLGFRVWGLVRIEGLGVRVQDLGFWSIEDPIIQIPPAGML